MSRRFASWNVESCPRFTAVAQFFRLLSRRSAKITGQVEKRLPDGLKQRDLPGELAFG